MTGGFGVLEYTIVCGFTLVKKQNQVVYCHIRHIFLIKLANRNYGLWDKHVYIYIYMRVCLPY